MGSKIRAVVSFLAPSVVAIGTLLLLVGYVPAFKKFLLAGAPSAGQTWGTSYEADPLGSDPLSEGDDWIRRLKTDIRGRAAVEHDWGNLSGSPTDDDGRHLEGSARVFYEASAPATLTRGDWTTGGTASSSTLDAGRLWYDSDNGASFIHDGTDWDAPFPGALSGTINLLSTPKFTTTAASAGNAYNPAAYAIRNIVSDITVGTTGCSDASSWTVFGSNVFGASGTCLSSGAMDMANRSANSKVLIHVGLEFDDGSPAGTCSIGVYLNNMATAVGPTMVMVESSDPQYTTYTIYATNIATGSNTFELHAWHSSGTDCSADEGYMTVVDLGPD